MSASTEQSLQALTIAGNALSAANACITEVGKVAVRLEQLDGALAYALPGPRSTFRQRLFWLFTGRVSASQQPPPVEEPLPEAVH
mgnify:CR=1 FL=1